MTRRTGWLVSCLMLPLLTSCLPDSGPAAGGPVRDAGGTIGLVLHNSKLDKTYNWTIETLGVNTKDQRSVQILSARYRHVSPGLEIVSFRGIDHSKIADMSFLGDAQERLPAGTLGSLSKVTLNPHGERWELLCTLRTHKVGSLMASDLLVTYRVHGKTYVRELKDNYIGFDVTGAGADPREHDKILTQGDAPHP